MKALHERKDFTRESFAKYLNLQLDELMDVERPSRLSVSCVNQMLSLIGFGDGFFKDRKTQISEFLSEANKVIPQFLKSEMDYDIAKTISLPCSKNLISKKA